MKLSFGVMLGMMCLNIMAINDALLSCCRQRRHYEVTIVRSMSMVLWDSYSTSWVEIS